MAIGTRLTLAGARLLAKALQGKQLKFTRGAFGDAKVNGKLVEPTDEQQDNLNALINERMSLPIYAFKFGDNGDFLVTVKVKNENLTSTFKAAECGLFAKDPDTGSEFLYGYCYEGNDGDKIHSKSSYCVLEYYLEFTTTIGNAKNVTCVVNIQEKIKAGAGLSRLGDTINANTGVGIGVSSLNNIYLKRATSTEKGGVIITGNDGLIMDEETLKPALGVGLGISAAKNIYLKRATDTEKGGVIVTGNDGLKMDGETIKAAVGTGLGISDAGNIYLKRATSTEKGGVIITGNDGLKMDGETIKAAVGTGLGISAAKNIYLKRATDTEKGGVIITGDDGLIMDEETLKPALGVGLGISAAKNIYLKRATDTEKGGVIVTGNDGLKMDGETIKAAVGTGLGISDAGNIYLKRATDTEKGGVIITGEDGLIMDGETLKATGGELESRVKQLEINQSNLYMVMNAEHELGITANLLLVEDWVKCDCTDRTATTCDADKDMVRYKCFDVLTNANFAKIGRDYSLVWQGEDREIQITDVLDGNNQAGERAFVYYFTGDTDDLHDLVPRATSDISKPLNNAKLYRTTAGVVTGKYAYGPGNLFRQLLRRVSFNGTISSTSKTFNMSTQSGQESNFTITDGKLTSDGYFTIN